MSETLFIASGDLGGSNCRSGIVAYEQGEARFIDVSYHAANTKNESDLAFVLREGIGRTVQHYRGLISGIALAVAGPIPDHREMIKAPNTKCLHDITPFNIADTLQRTFEMESWCANDVEAACAGETEKGSLRGAQWAMFENIGSGWGGAYILNGIPVAAEPGHIVVGRGGVGATGKEESCGCGKTGCAEAQLSGVAIDRRLREMHAQGQILIPEDRWNNPSAFADEEAENGAPWAVEFYTGVAQEIGDIWGSKLNLCPPMTDIVYQGSFLECAMRIRFFREEVQRTMLARSMLPAQHAKVRIRQVSAPTFDGKPLGPIYGAASIWKRLHDERAKEGASAR